MSEIDFNKIVAFIPSAGLGTRLKPLTNSIPKALVEFMGHSMLEGVLSRLSAVGFNKFIINIHHFPTQIRDAVNQLSGEYDIRISDETPKLLDTGGGVQQAVSMLTDSETTLLVHNVDIFSQVDIVRLIETHIKNANDVTFAVSSRETARKLVFNDGFLTGWVNAKTKKSIGDSVGSHFAYSGIHIVEKRMFIYCNDSISPFPLIPFFLSKTLVCKMGMFEHSANGWYDLGSVDRIRIAEDALRNKKNRR